MAESTAPILAIAIALPLAAAFSSALPKARSIAAGALGVTLVLLLGVVRQALAAGGSVAADPWKLPSLRAGESWLMADGLNAVPMALFVAIALVTVIVAPRRDVNRAFLISLLTLTSATLAVYAAANLAVFLAGWIASMMPLILRPANAPYRRPPVFVFAASALLLAVALILIAAADTAAPHGTMGGWPFALVVLAAILRECLFPFHWASVSLFDDRPVLLAALLGNSHLGVFLIARVAMPLFPEIAAGALPWLGGMALFTSLYTAVLGIVEREPRRLLALLIASQSSALLAGLATASHEGVAGALMQWIVLAVSSTVLIAVYRSLEVRIDRPFGGSGFMGLASSMPRLAVFFAVAGLTMVGLPGTLGFAGEDLLLHGVLAGYSWWGAALPLAIALNAYHVFRLFARLFLGKDEVTRYTAADALPRERWALSACLAFLVWGGLVPKQVVSLQAHATGALVRTIGLSPDGHR
ncbi:MAG: proton-conducting transporter membrane subunit [Bryobacteraceae bacterium]